MRRTTNKAFTLVELMVVIAIIATLIGILLPAMGVVKKNVKITSTKVTISVFETGIQSFMADTRVGGSLPPSCSPNIAVTGVPARRARSPHRVEVKRFCGASYLLWALAGADLLGTPGFQDIDGNGTWGDNTAGPPGPASSPDPLYALNATGGPVYPRSGPYIDISKMKLPKAVGPANPGRYIIPAAKDALNQANQLLSPCFLDSWGQPILYYRASPANATYIVTNTGDLNHATDAGVYDLADNAQITGLSGGAPVAGIDLGRGQLPTDSYHTEVPKYHYLAYPGEVFAEPAVVLSWLNSNIPAVQKYSFGYTIWNPSVTATPRPYNDKSYILLSAGPDGVYGTPDDIANFDVK